MKRNIKKILLVNPKKPLEHVNPDIHSMFERNKERLKPWSAPSLNLLIIAALTPANIEIKIVDEYYETIDFDESFDLVGITAMTQQAMRAYEVADIFRRKNIPVVMGGIHASVLPHEALEHVDTVFVGESEETWKEYLRDFETGTEKRIYNNKQPFNLEKSPLPRYDLIDFKAFQDLNNYFNYIPVQATRGCPHDCTFCAVSKFYGRKIRMKKVEQIVNEIKHLQQYDKDSLILFADDNLFVNRRFAKELMKALIPLKIKYFAQTDIKVADDDELLKLIYASGCQILFIGFESLSPESLGEINSNNWKQKQIATYKEHIQNIQDNGMIAFGGFVVGFEHDNLESFNHIKQFTLDNNIPGQFTILTPIPGSQLYTDLKVANRLYHDVFWDNGGFYNLVFKHNHIEPGEAQNALIKLYDEVYNTENSFKRFLHMKDKYKKLPPRWQLKETPIPT